MSNDKPSGVATIKFYPNKHVEVELSSIQNITPRTLDIASNILGKTYRSMKHKFIAGEHRKAREAKIAADEKAEADEIAFHKAEDERLTKDMPKGKAVETKTEAANDAKVEKPATAKTNVK